MELGTRALGLAAAAAAAIVAASPLSAAAPDVVRAQVQEIADRYVAETAASEHATGISISVSLPGAGAVNVVAGTVAATPDAAPMTPDTLFQIGSITKSFTAAALLQLQAEGRLGLDDTLGKWLPEYPAWKDVTIRRLLNMTSGIPTYEAAPAILESLARIGLDRHFSPAVLAGFVDPTYPGAPAATTGYDYSNTNYILAGMIIERAGGIGVQEAFESRFFGTRFGLTSTYYREGVYPPGIADRMASGYFVDDPARPAMAVFDGRDMKLQDMSWAGAAGAIVSRPEEVNRWVRALFTSDLLDSNARAQLAGLVSMQTGAAIPGTSAADPQGFGLGVSGFTTELGTGWFYEGETMGYRVIYVYETNRDVVATVALNSGAEDPADSASALIRAVVQAALQD